MDDLDHEVLINIFSHVGPADVARLRAVCRTWDAVIQQAEVARAVLKRTWGITDLVGYPRKKSLYLVAGLSHFAIQHTCRYWESLTSVAVHYNVDVAAIRVLNNLISEHSLRSRQYVFVPVQREQIRGKAARFIYDKVVDRDLIIISDNIDKLLAGTPECEKCQIAILDDGVLKLSQLLGRGLRIDENTAKFYLADAGGDLKKAIKLFEEDRRWEFKGQ
ncbi:g6599 [Coccomyxa elongata]